MKIAVISDIHGNCWALSNVLKDIEKRKPDLIVNLGDSLYGPLKPIDTYKLIKSCDIVSISGNQDRFILENLSKVSENRTLQYVIDELDDKVIDWLSTLPATMQIEPDIFAFHGTPMSDTTYLLENLRDGCILVNEEQAIEEYLRGIVQKIIFCGHSHTPRLVQTTNRLVINPGSIGLQAYDDGLPIYHKMENFNNLAQYCMVDIEEGTILTEQIGIQYDYYKAVKCAADNNRMDWADWIKNGKV